MDRKLDKKTWTPKRIGILTTAVLVVSLLAYQLLFADGRSSLNVNMERLSIASVTQGEFTDYIPVSGNVEAGETFYLDAIEGGVIQEILKESGVEVNKGDTILILANSNLQLDVMQRETMLYEQVNNLRQTRLLLDQNDLNQQAQLAEIDYQINLLKPQYERLKTLREQNLISQRELEEVKEQYDYNVKRKSLTYRSYRNDSMARAIQMRQLMASEQRMSRSLDAVGHILDNLVIKASRKGQLSTENLEVGQSVSTGFRLGQIDNFDRYKIRVQIDELYLPRVGLGQTGSFSFAGNSYDVKISKIYPTITSGRFEVDMTFVSDIPAGIKRGQTVRIRLELGNSAQALLLPVGGFFKDTGGNWVYVLEPGSNRAVKREIKLGRKNPDFYEILEGLQPGEKVIVSSYETFGKNEVLNLK